MAYTKKKARKKRKPVQYEAPMTDEEKAKIQYKDDFQKTWGSRVEDFADKVGDKRKQILYGLAALAVLIIIAGIFYTYQRRQNNQAQLALGNAIETSQALVTDTPLPAGSTQKTFKTEKERAETAINEFQAVADKFGGAIAEKARYFIAVNKLVTDREAGISELQTLSSNTGEIGSMSKFALAQAYTNDDKFDEAIKVYQDLADDAQPIIATETINFELAKIYEEQDKKDEAVELYYNIVKNASEAKDLEGNAVEFTQTANDAKAKLQELAPEKAKELENTAAPPTEIPAP